MKYTATKESIIVQRNDKQEPEIIVIKINKENQLRKLVELTEDDYITLLSGEK